MNNNSNNMMQNPMMGAGMMQMGQNNPGLNMTQNYIMSTDSGGMNIPAIGPIDPTAGMSVYKPSGSGTLLSDLVKGDELVKTPTNINKQFGPMTHNMQGYGMYSGIERMSNTGNINIDNINPKYNYGQKTKRNGSQYGDSTRDSDSDYSSIRQLANDVNNSLQALAIEKMEQNKKRKKSIASSMTDSDNDSNNDNNDNEPFETEHKVAVPEIELETDYVKVLTEFLLLLTLYVIMSQPFVISFACSYIHQLNCTEDGTVNMTGIIIYGMIMVVLFMVVRKIVFSRM